MLLVARGVVLVAGGMVLVARGVVSVAREVWSQLLERRDRGVALVYSC